MSSYNNDKDLPELRRYYAPLRYGIRVAVVALTIAVGWMAYDLTWAMTTNVWPWWASLNPPENPAHPLEAGNMFVLMVGAYWMATGYAARVAIRSVGRLVWPSKFPVKD